uniref:PPM-type phosphatase domain-containing protein n=1 Tax=Corethron hystrix TaxID=216773 RepID=A0A7S1FP12_9STRA|mmetsp:Transcript_1710/g.3598  ORF Transcript_1710/g.3598 Transcript_1710/m.3598 type:complete len:628 (+) Transcript_1710:170-2053(+)
MNIAREMEFTNKPIKFEPGNTKVQEKSMKKESATGSAEFHPTDNLPPGVNDGHLIAVGRQVRLPSFLEPSEFMSTSTYEANAPSEDRSASLLNVLLKPHVDSCDEDAALVRLNLWCVLDGHGGGSVASYASEVLLPHVAVSLAHALESTIVSNGKYRVNKEGRNIENDEMKNLVANVTDVDPNGINYSHPEDDPVEKASDLDDSDSDSVESPAVVSDDASNVSVEEKEEEGEENLYRVTSDKKALTGTHHPAEIESVKEALTKSFLAVDSGWINSIDSTEIQSSCMSGGKWNAGACALVACIIQRLSIEKSLPTRHKHKAMLYTAHCGDCRAVLATSVPRLTSFGSFGIPIDHSEGSSEDDESDDAYPSPFSFQWSSSALTLMRPTKRRRIDSMSDRDGDALSSSSSNSLTRTKNDREVRNKNLNDIVGLKAVELTADQNAYNMVEVGHVIARSNNAPRAISSASNGGIRRVAGSLAVTRALGDAYLKTPELSFLPYKLHVPYITARPDISHRLLTSMAVDNQSLCDRFLILASDGVWEQSSNDEVVDWLQNFEKRSYDSDHEDLYDDEIAENNISGCIISGVVNNISRIRRIPKRALLKLPQGRPRRSKHDDITACVVDLSGFVVI